MPGEAREERHGRASHRGDGVHGLAAGHRVLGLARSEESARKLEERGIRAVRGDITDAGSVREAAREAEAVVHAALMHAQEIYRAAFNSAEEQYDEESRRHRVAWGAVEQKYEKNEEGKWVEKEEG